jgi:hypothetical protein
MSHDKVLSLLQAASAALTEATYIMKDSVLPLPASPPSPISPSATSMTEVDCEGYFFDESHLADGNVHVKIWSVPGNDNMDGRLANVAVHTNSYGISLKRQTDIAEQVLASPGPRVQVLASPGPRVQVLGPLGYCVVDKEKWDVAKEISVGDIFYMTNPTDGMVYRGIVTAQPVGGPFCPIRCIEKSFVACLGLVSDNDLRSEVELVFKVDWKVYANYDQEWYEFLKVVGEGVCRLPDE